MHLNKSRILGIDPGLATTGISVIELLSDNSYKALYCACIETKKTELIHQRLKKIYFAIDEIIKQYVPAFLAIEELFFSANVKTAIDVGQARGVSMLAATNNDLDIYEYTPLEVKQAVVGYGRATKDQIKYMAKIILNLQDDKFPKKDDAWDSIAIAITHANFKKFRDKTKQ
jgi:crossover junction endodeoxyribonuclease RuvC